MRAFSFLLGGTAVFFGLLLAAAFVLPPPFSWAIGVAYIAYDTWLLWHMLLSSRAALSMAAPPDALQGGGPAVAVLIAAHNERQALPHVRRRLDRGRRPAAAPAGRRDRADGRR